MGWKLLKEHYAISKQIAFIEEGCFIIGSGYIPMMLCFDAEGTLIKENTMFSNNPDIMRIKQQVAENKELFAKLFKDPDVFDDNIKVYTFKGANIIEELCEKPGYPNLTHNGEVMYDNTFSTDVETVKNWARQSAAARVAYFEREITSLKESLMRAELNFKEALADQVALSK